jgi:hypothetical protein
MAQTYPGYNVDPRVKKVIDRCISIGMNDLYKPYANNPVLFKFSSLERDRCAPAKLKVGRPTATGTRPGLLVLKQKPPAKITIKPRRRTQSV